MDQCIADDRRQENAAAALGDVVPTALSKISSVI
jgi:hypothetical protein